VAGDYTAQSSGLKMKQPRKQNTMEHSRSAHSHKRSEHYLVGRTVGMISTEEIQDSFAYWK
jgi:hypothetical protein